MEKQLFLHAVLPTKATFSPSTGGNFNFYYSFQTAGGAKVTRWKALFCPFCVCRIQFDLWTQKRRITQISALKLIYLCFCPKTEISIDAKKAICSNLNVCFFAARHRIPEKVQKRADKVQRITDTIHDRASDVYGIPDIVQRKTVKIYNSTMDFCRPCGVIVKCQGVVYTHKKKRGCYNPISFTRL